MYRSIRLDGELTSVKVSANSQYALINHAPDVRFTFLYYMLDSHHYVRRFIYGTCMRVAWHASILANVRDGMLSEVVLEGLTATLLSVEVKVWIIHHHPNFAIR